MKASPSSGFVLRMQEKAGDLKTHQWVYQLLRMNLLCGRIGPGHALTIRGLAQLLEVSPMPIREALHRLACEGAIEVMDNRRVIVPMMNADKFNELCELRILLETHAAVAALPHIGKANIEILIAIDNKINAAVDAGEVEAIALSNQHFHRSLYSANPSQRSVPLIESLWLQLGPFSRIVISKLEIAYQVDRHIEIIEALKYRHENKLRQAVEADIRDGIASMKSLEGLQQYFQGVA